MIIPISIFFFYLFEFLNFLSQLADGIAHFSQFFEEAKLSLSLSIEQDDVKLSWSRRHGLIFVI